MRTTKQLLSSAIIVGIAVTLIPSVPATAGDSARHDSKAYDPPADWMFPAECGGHWGYPSGSMIRNPRVIFQTRPGERFVDLTITDLNPKATVAALVNQTDDLSGEVICGQARLPISDDRPLHVWIFQRTGGPGASVAAGGRIEATFHRQAAAPQPGSGGGG